tara:strand:- start:182 stop:481 length:300 start_codon:yes stop_codon:yes gene_type:complete
MTSDKYLRLEREGTETDGSYVTSVDIELSDPDDDIWMVLEAWLIVSRDSVMRPHSAEFHHARIITAGGKRSPAMDIDWIGENMAQEIEWKFMKELQEGE